MGLQQTVIGGNVALFLCVFALGDRLSGGRCQYGEFKVLSWALIFFVVAIIAAVFGFGGIASASAGIAQILFFIFLVLFAVSLIIGLARGGRPPLT
jgi:uncharacterized membrane protein YtjA (UPF0391 family)